MFDGIICIQKIKNIIFEIIIEKVNTNLGWGGHTLSSHEWFVIREYISCAISGQALDFLTIKTGQRLTEYRKHYIIKYKKNQMVLEV